ncbi:uncharacterized protein LOC123293653 [Chrysoperla carnea]|uniref:uncharacterized protein LOC123293653 n=1 Tax=Chrysoperla carnea TaxID=189513 RepID=UPI001D07B078|nr:uncharacterized protein LOC123293653 [Chrysoperla carnea]
MDTPPQESRRRSVLSEISIQSDGIIAQDGIRTPVANLPQVTPTTSPDELIIQTRGPRKIPVTWSPVDLAKITPPSTQDQETTPRKSPPKDLRRSVRKLRLFLTPEKNPSRNLFAEFSNKKLKLNTPSY